MSKPTHCPECDETVMPVGRLEHCPLCHTILDEDKRETYERRTTIRPFGLGIGWLMFSR